MDSAVNYLLQYHDTSLVEIAVMALMKENIDVDFAAALMNKAVVMTVQQKKDEDIELAVAAGRIPPCQISWKDPEPYVVSLEEAARERGYHEPYFENPGDRMMRLKRGHELSVSMIFLPTGRATAKRVPDVQLSVWNMIQEKARTTTNPPNLYRTVHILNVYINTEIMEEKKKAQGKGREDEVPGTS